jgi:hypothetical protein
MEHRPSSEADSRSAGQEIPSLFLQPEVRYCVHKSPPLDHIQSRMHLINFTSHFFAVNFNIVYPSSHNVLSLVLDRTSIATDYGLDDRGSNPGEGWEIFSSTPCPARL